MKQVDDRHILRVRPLISPAVLGEEMPISDRIVSRIEEWRSTTENILDGRDSRLIIIVGPCSVHDPDAVLDYAQQLKQAVEKWEDRLFVIMRVYFEKPRTVVGWKGLINDPDLDESFRINKGLHLARQLLLDVAEVGLPAGTEFLDTTFGQYYADLVTWAAIGARTVESQIHRELASGLSMPVGIKNRTDGDVQVAADAIRAARHRHLFPSLTKEGAPAIYETGGNAYAHLVLRGGDRTGPNFDSASVAAAIRLLQDNGINPRLMIDCSHGNSGKDPEKQKTVVASVCEQIVEGVSEIRGLMLESHLKNGRQEWRGEDSEYGMSITDACLSLDETLPLLGELHEAMGAKD